MAKVRIEEEQDPIAKLIGDLRGELKIDRHDLDSEIEKQADVYYRVAEAMAMAASRRDERKTRSEERFAEVSEELRNKYSTSKERTTEGKLKELALLDPFYQKAVRLYFRAKRDYDSLAAMERAFDMRGKMLRELAQLHIAGYYQQSAIKGSGNRIRDVAAERGREGMARSRADG